eukprot:281368-Chlamydomonas_euryale.AAC.1
MRAPPSNTFPCCPQLRTAIRAACTLSRAALLAKASAVAVLAPDGLWPGPAVGSAPSGLEWAARVLRAAAQSWQPGSPALAAFGAAADDAAGHDAAEGAPPLWAQAGASREYAAGPRGDGGGGTAGVFVGLAAMFGSIAVVLLSSFLQQPAATH